MPNYKSINKYNYTSGSELIKRMESESNLYEKGNGSLIIDDNTIYEIDDDCVERIRKNKANQRQPKA